MEYVKKQAFGGIRTCEKDEATHVLQNVSEYSEMIEIAAMYRDSSLTAQKKEKRIKEKYADLQSETAQLREDNVLLRNQIAMSSQETKRINELEKKKEELSGRIAELEVEVDQERNLNKNLLRISRERANADRKITPKKQHDGYIVIESREWWERRLGKGMIRTWRSIIQTPFDASMEPDVAEKQIVDDLISFVLTSIGCDKYVQPKDNGMLPDDDSNVLYAWRAIADYRTGYYSILINTTKPLIVQPDRRARHYWERNKKTRNKISSK